MLHSKVKALVSKQPRPGGFPILRTEIGLEKAAVDTSVHGTVIADLNVGEKAPRVAVNTPDGCDNCGSILHRLPTEIREMIHKMLLVVGTVYPACGSELQPFKSYWDGSPQLTPDANWISALRSFCGNLADEAERVLYRENTIILDVYNYREVLGDMVSGCYGEDFEPSDRKKARMKSVKVKLDSNIYRIDMGDDRSLAEDAWDDATLDSQEKRLAHIHQLSIEALCECFWGEFLTQISELSLSHLELDLEDITCPIGCCRVTDEVAWTLDFSKTRLPKKITIHQALDQEEDYMINIMESLVPNLPIGDGSESRHGGCLEDNEGEEGGDASGDEVGNEDVESDGHRDEDENADEVL